MSAEGDKVPPTGLRPGDLRSRRQTLQRERLRLQAEITGYPMPIPGCDAYFNGLLEERTRVCEELARIEQALRG